MQSETSTPQSYIELESSPVPLLSRVYEHLKLHFERQSPPLTRAIIAFILTNTSQEYIHGVALSVGFGGLPSENPSKPSAKRNEYEFDVDDEDEDEEDIFDLFDKTETSFPTFFPNAVLHALPAAQKSLVLFRIAQPDHPMLVSPPRMRPFDGCGQLQKLLQPGMVRLCPQILEPSKPLFPLPSRFQIPICLKWQISSNLILNLELLDRIRLYRPRIIPT